MKKLLLLFFLITNLAFSQSKSIETIFDKIAAEKDDTARLNILLDFFSYTAESNPLLDINNTQKLLLYARKNNDLISESEAFSKLGYNYRSLGNLEKSLSYNLKAVEIAEKTKNEKLLVNTKMNLSYTYKDLNNFPKAISLQKYVAENAAKINFYEAQT